MTYSLPRAYAVFCGRFIITVNLDYLYAPKQGKLASVCLQRFSSIFETSVLRMLCFKHYMSLPEYKPKSTVQAQKE